MCWGEKVENRCPIDHSISTTTRWFGCQYGQDNLCPNPFLILHHTKTICTSCHHEFELANPFLFAAPSPNPRDWEVFKREFRHTHNPDITSDYVPISPSSIEIPCMIQNLPGTEELPTYAFTMQETSSPPTWYAHYPQHPYTLGHATRLASHRLSDLHDTTPPLYHRLQRLRSSLIPGTHTAATVTYIRTLLLDLESTAESHLHEAQELEQSAVNLALAIGFMVSFDLQQAFLDAEYRCRYLYMRLLDDSFGDAEVVRRRFEAWIEEIETHGEFRRRGRVVDEMTPLLPLVVRESFVEVVGWDVGDLWCVVAGALCWFMVLWILWYNFG